MKGFLIFFLLVAFAFSAQAAEPLVTLELRDAQLEDVLRAIGQQYGINILFSGSVTGKVTATIREVPLKEALNSILKTSGYAALYEGVVVIVRSEREAQASEEVLLIKEFRLMYMPSEKAAAAVREILSGRGRAAAVEFANTVIVKDIAPIIAKVSDLIGRLDKRPNQFLIEGRIVEMKSGSKRRMGINWEAAGRQNRPFDRPGTLGGNFSVNLPPGVEEGGAGGDGGAGGAFGFGLLLDRANLNLRLSAMEDSGEAKVLSSPKILVVEGEEASISSGEELLVPISKTATVITTSGNSSQKPVTFDAKIELIVRPRIVDGELIGLSINTRREEFDYGKQVEGYPPKLTRTATTELIMKNGETVVIGGVYGEGSAVSERGVPFLSKIPLLGRLFKEETRAGDKTELLIFLTPNIYRDDACRKGEPGC